MVLIRMVVLEFLASMEGLVAGKAGKAERVKMVVFLQLAVNLLVG